MGRVFDREQKVKTKSLAHGPPAAQTQPRAAELPFGWVKNLVFFSGQPYPESGTRNKPRPTKAARSGFGLSELLNDLDDVGMGHRGRRNRWPHGASTRNWSTAALALRVEAPVIPATAGMVSLAPENPPPLQENLVLRDYRFS